MRANYLARSPLDHADATMHSMSNQKHRRQCTHSTAAFDGVMGSRILTFRGSPSQLPHNSWGPIVSKMAAWIKNMEVENNGLKQG
jgi:hypothetical protein